jgi:hypothetical protein
LPGLVSWLRGIDGGKLVKGVRGVVAWIQPVALWAGPP